MFWLNLFFIALVKMAPTTRSAVRKFFNRTAGEKTECKICGKFLKASGNTSNLRSHLTRMHPKCIEDNGISSSSSSSPMKSTSMNVTAMEVDSGYTTNQNASLENVNSIFCSNLTTEQSSSSIGDISAGPSLGIPNDCQGGAARAFKVEKALGYMIVKDNLPIEMCESEGFKNFCKMLLPSYEPPSKEKMWRMLQDKEAALAAKFRAKLKSANNMTLSVVSWMDADGTRKVLNVTMNFLDDSNVASVSLGVEELDENFTAVNVKEHVQNICKKWEINLACVVAVVTDRTVNVIKAAVDLFGKDKHLCCFGQTMNLIVETAIIETPEIDEIVCKVRRIVEFFYKNKFAASSLREQQIVIETTELELSLDSSGNWNCTFQMLENFVKLKDAVRLTLFKFPKGPKMISDAQLNTIKNTFTVLKNIHEITLELSNDAVAAGKIIPIINYLKFSLANVTDGNGDAAAKLKLKLLKHVEYHFKNIELCPLLAISTLLDPRFKKFHFVNRNGYSSAVSYLTKMLRNLPKETQAESPSSVARSKQGKSLRLTVPKQRSEISEIEELEYFLTSNVVGVNLDPIKVWKDLSTAFPTVYKLAQKYFSIRATALPYKNFFSAKNELSLHKLAKLVFLNYTEAEDWN